MTLKHALRSIELYGLKGILEYLKRPFSQRATQARWTRFLIHDKDFKPSPGITIIGDFSGSGSLSKVLRDFCINLRRASIPYQAYNTGNHGSIPESEYKGILTPLQEFKVNRYSDIIGMSSLPQIPNTGCRHSLIGFWEFESGLVYLYPHFAEPCNIIVHSDFNLQTFRQQLPRTTHVRKILYPFQFLSQNVSNADSVRLKYGIPSDAFMVFYNFDFCTGYFRKNPEAVVRAFSMAFKGNPAARLVFKTKNASKRPEIVARLNNLISDTGISENVSFINQFIPQEDLVDLTKASDAYLSLHRGEGFGLGIAEAMSLGKPAIVTRYSAPTEFCNSHNSILVPYTMMPVKDCERDIWQYKHVTSWAEPDIAAAAQALKSLYNNREYAKQLGENARASIAEQFSINNFKASVESFLKQDR